MLPVQTPVDPTHLAHDSQLLPDLLAAQPGGGAEGPAAVSASAPLVVAAAPGAAGRGREVPPLLLYLRGRLACARGDAGGGGALLEAAAHAMLLAAEGAPPGPELFACLEAPRVLEAAAAIMEGPGGGERAPGEAPAPALATCIRRVRARARAPACLRIGIMCFCRIERKKCKMEKRQDQFNASQRRPPCKSRARAGCSRRSPASQGSCPPRSWRTRARCT